MLKADEELKKILLLCDQKPAHVHGLDPEVYHQLKQYCREIIKYGGITYPMAVGKTFTDTTLLKPAKRFLRALKEKKDESK